jgi:hypothetical protein
MKFTGFVAEDQPILPILSYNMLFLFSILIADKILHPIFLLMFTNTN